jgi:phosphoribosylamine--glycine ligase
MNILVIGGGGREAALVYKIAQSHKVTKLFCVPGNAGIAQHATLAPIAVDQIDALLLFAKENQINLTVVGPELPLSLGVVDRFREAGLRIFGPSASAAQIETSKAFSKRFMQKYKIPTPEATVMSIQEGYERIRTMTLPIVLKMDGLAEGKGVCIAQNIQEAEAALAAFKDRGGEQILLERFLTGVEATFFVLADHDKGIPFSTAQDYKRLQDGDHGPNTGGMGSISPSPTITPAMEKEIMATIVTPALKGLVAEGASYQGILYVGLMLTAEGPFVLEFNARLGDPEAQSVLRRLQTDWIDIVDAVLEHRLDQLRLDWDDAVAVSVVLASEGYPGPYKKGEVISGLDGIDDPIVTPFHSGTKKEGDKILTNGGRVLCLTAIGADREEARARAYRAVDRVSFHGMQFRKDIGKSPLPNSTPLV